jgi:putative acetyltransferase
MVLCDDMWNTVCHDVFAKTTRKITLSRDGVRGRVKTRLKFSDSVFGCIVCESDDVCLEGGENMDARRFDGNFHRIELATESDAAGIAALYKKVWDEYRGRFPNELVRARQPSVEQMKEWMRQDAYFVVKIGSRIVGVMGCSLKHGMCLLMHMVVDRGYRKRGIGSALTEKAINYAKENGATKVWLDTTPRLTEAMILYEKHGFVRCGHLRKHYWGEDVYFYELVF